MKALDEGMFVYNNFCNLSKWKCQGWIKARGSLRKGDPLSPFLFTILANVLSRLMVRAKERGLFRGF